MWHKLGPRALEFILQCVSFFPFCLDFVENKNFKNQLLGKHFRIPFGETFNPQLLYVS